MRKWIGAVSALVVATAVGRLWKIPEGRNQVHRELNQYGRNADNMLKCLAGGIAAMLARRIFGERGMRHLARAIISVAAGRFYYRVSTTPDIGTYTTTQQKDQAFWWGIAVSAVLGIGPFRTLRRLAA